jgi:uncharacterized protein (TIGR03067 family)
MFRRPLLFVALTCLLVPGNAVSAFVWQGSDASPPAAQDPAVAQDPAAEEKKVFDPAILIGEWAITSGKRQGADVAADRFPPSVIFNAEKLTMPVGEGPDEAFVMSYKIDTSADPVAVDFDIVSGPAPEGHAVGILKWDGTELTLCYDPMGADRPDAFSTSEEDGRFLFVLTKKSKPFDAAAMQGTWSYVSGNKAGEEVPVERLIGDVVITGKDFTLPAGPEDTFVMSYSITSDGNPASIDLKIESGPVPEGKAVGLIQVDGDQLTFCYDPVGENRPAKLEATAENGCFLFTLKRKEE